MKCPFCYLENDNKTFDYVKEYLSVLRAGDSPLTLDITIQKREIEAHLIRNAIPSSDQKAITDWIEKNSANFRSYLNSIKMVALFLFYVKKAEHIPEESPLPFELFTEAVAFWNERKIEVVDSIYI